MVSVQASFLWISPSGLLFFPQLPSSAAHCLVLMAGFRHGNAFDAATSSTVPEGRPVVPWPHPGCLELILVSSWEAP